jgi:hypothetical protein
MAHTNDASDITRTIHERAAVANRSGVSWILAAFGSLVAGLAGGTIMFARRPDWVWPFPLAGFLGYVFAFRRGLLLWNPGVDRTWREYLWLDRDTASEDGQPANRNADPSGQAKSLRAVRPDPPRTPQHDLRAVR